MPAQAPRPAQTPIGVIYNTSMSRPDAALALGALYSSASRLALRVASVCVTGSGLGAAAYCDLVNRFYVPRLGGSNTVLAVGLTAGPPLPVDPGMVKAALDRKKPDGEPQYVRGIERVSDTSLAEAVLRNAATLTTQSAVVLSAPATSLARALELPGAKSIFQQRVKRLVIVDTGEPRTDGPALLKLVADWPGPIFLSGKSVGDSLLFPGSKLDALLAWAPAHPIADAYRAFKPMPYDAPLFDVAAVSYAATPDADFFTVSEGGTLSLRPDGRIVFSAGEGSVRQITIEPLARQRALDALVTMATSAPAPPPGRGRRGA